MKKKRIALLILTAMLLSGCQPNPNTGSSQTDSPADTEQSRQESVVDSQQSQPEQIPDASTITICGQSQNEIRDAIQARENMTLGEDFVVSAPEQAAVYTYTAKAGGAYKGMQECDRQFRALFAYFFPDHTIYNEHLYYTGGSSKLIYNDDGTIEQDYHLVSDWYDKLIAGDEGRVNYLYDETWKRNVDEWNGQVCLETGNPVGYGYFVMNKGKLVGKLGKTVYDEQLQADRYPLLSSFDPADRLTPIATYAPSSTESYPLLDKEMPIHEAVAFFEEYVNSTPYPEESNLETKVASVDVMKIGSDTYGYYFHTTACFRSVIYDYSLPGSRDPYDWTYNQLGGYGFMLESNDVDVMYGYYRLTDIESATPLSSVITPVEAVAAISEAMSDYVPFVAQKLEFVYTQKSVLTEEGYVNTETYETEVVPAWKMTLYHSNDDLTYICYVNAADGKQFRYDKLS